MADGEKISRMLVVSTDNYENLEPYFPTAPVKIGLSAIGKILMKYILRHKKISISMLVM